jgi:hypothetical protein
MHDVGTVCLAFERTLDGFDLTADAPDAVEQLLPVANGVSHGENLEKAYTLQGYCIASADVVQCRRPKRGWVMIVDAKSCGNGWFDNWRYDA